MHGGSIVARSEGWSRGSEFVVRLPCMPPGTAGAGIARRNEDSRPDAATPRPAGPQLHILVIEDNKDVRETLMDLLRALGHRVRRGRRRR